MIMVYPKKNAVKTEEMQYLKRYHLCVSTLFFSYSFSFLDAFEAALFGFERGDRSYSDYIDMKSFVDYFLITEVTKNPDGYRGSTYLHKVNFHLLKLNHLLSRTKAVG